MVGGLVEKYNHTTKTGAIASTESLVSGHKQWNEIEALPFATFALGVVSLYNQIIAIGK